MEDHDRFSPQLSVELITVADLTKKYGHFRIESEYVPEPKDQTYTTSELNSNNKRTDGLMRCVAVVLSGTNNRTGENVSQLLHVSPKVLIRNAFLGRRTFESDFRRILKTFYLTTQSDRAASSYKGFVDDFPEHEFARKTNRDVFQEMFYMLNRCVKTELGFTLKHKYGPNRQSTELILHNDSRRVFIINENTY